MNEFTIFMKCQFCLQIQPTLKSLAPPISQHWHKTNCLPRVAYYCEIYYPENLDVTYLLRLIGTFDFPVIYVLIIVHVYYPSRFYISCDY